MQNVNAGSFNKEKLIFMISSAVVAGGLYLFLTSGPIPLVPGPPVSYTQGKPEPLKSSVIAAREPEDFYVVDGKISKLPDKRTGQLVNRDRKSPFMPFEQFANKTPVKVVNVAATTPPPPPPPPAAPEKPKDPKKEFVGTTAEAEVEFMGVMTMANGETFGLLKPKDGSPTIRVKLGSEIEAGGTKYTVTALEKQAIWVTDGEQRPFVLKDSTFDGSSDESDSSSSSDKTKPVKTAQATKPSTPAPTPQKAATPATPAPKKDTPTTPKRPHRNKNDALKG